MNKIQQGATSLPQNRPEPYIEQRVVHTFTGVSVHQEPVEVSTETQEDYLRTIYDIMLGAMGEDSGAPEFEVFSLGMTRVDIDYVLQNLESYKDHPLTVFNEGGGGGNTTVRSLFESVDGEPIPTPIVAYQDAISNYYILVEYVKGQNAPIRSVCCFSANI